MLGRGAAPVEVHELDHETFLDEVHSFEFWFHAVQGYLAGTTHGHRPDATDVLLDDAHRDRLITALCNYALGETAALEGASGLVAIAPNRHAKIFLATQVADEARHLEAFLWRLGSLGVDDPEREVERRACRGLHLFRRRLLELVATRDWESAIFAQNVVLESLEFAVFREHATTADPITAEILRGIVKDERRHIGFGENELGRRLREVAPLRARIDRRRRELDHLVLDALEEVARHVGVSPDEEWRMASAYRDSVERLGVAS